MEAKRWQDRGRGRGPRPDGLRRQAATGATLAKYRKKAFDWGKGVHCIAMARFHAKQMGHKVPPLPPVRSALGAKKALQKLGHAGVGDLLATMFEPIAPAMMLPGDLAVFPGGEGLDAVMICAGNKLFGWWDGEPKMEMLDLVDAWGNPVPENDEAPELAGQKLADIVRAFRL